MPPVVLSRRRPRVLASINPLIYEVDAPRALMLRGEESVIAVATDFGVLTLRIAVLIGVAAQACGRTGS